jgi:cobaltochelatase CobN
MDTAGEGLENAENLLVYLTMKSKVTYIAYSASDALEMASQTNDHSDLIEYTYIPAFNTTTWNASDELLAASESGFLGTQDVIFCDMLSSKVFGAVDETLQSAE